MVSEPFLPFIDQGYDLWIQLVINGRINLTCNWSMIMELEQSVALSQLTQETNRSESLELLVRAASGNVFSFRGCA